LYYAGQVSLPNAAVTQVQDSVVRVFVSTPQYTMCGSGVIVSSGGYILTAAHLLENGHSISVVLPGFQACEATVVATHPLTDLALLRVSVSGLKPVRFRVPLDLREGEEVWAWGYPECSEELEVVHCSVGRLEANLPQGTVWYNGIIKKGMSGGAVVDRDGNLVAIHFELPAAEGGGRGISAERCLSLIPAEVPFLLSNSGSLVTVQWVLISEPVEPGDVLELEPTRPGFYRKARGPCSPLVAGVVSTQPGVVLGHSGDTQGKALIALIGIVPVKVTDEGGPIWPGDLLVPSSIPGSAMRWDPKQGEACAFLGKALEPCSGKRGIVLTLLMGW
jgi:hypothetical protein